MATLREEIVVAASPEMAWDAVRDVGALATRLVPGFVSEVRMEPGVRIVTFANGLVVREPIVAIDEAARRLVWTSEGGAARHYNASLQVLSSHDGGSLLLWIADFLPDEIAPRISAAMKAGAAAMRTAFAPASPRTGRARAALTKGLLLLDGARTRILRRRALLMSQVVTRFAPSPTGFLHIGGARTALFNWLYAKRFGGKFLLRIEDTDRERSTDAAVGAILDGLHWLGLEWDGETVMQFSRVERHREVALQMLSQGRAYRCYCSPEELAEMREKQRLEGKPMRYDGRWRDRDPSEAPAGVAPVIRLKSRQEGETVVDDKVQGKVTFPNRDLDDLILLRSDGNPTYMLAVVVDDHDMGVTHIIRGDDHLTNAARQTQIYEALGWSVPIMAHIPLIHGPDGAKLSKRHGALGVDAYRALGYLPLALRNYLVRLGWSQGDREFFSTEEMIAAFDLPAIGRSPSRFDFVKLENMNGHFMRSTPDDELLKIWLDTLPYLPGGPEIAAQLDDFRRAQLAQALPGLKERAKTLVELTDGAQFLFAKRPLALEPKAEEILAKGGRLHIRALLPQLEALNEWTAATTEAVVRDYANAQGAKLGVIAQPLRAAATGRSTSPGIFDVLAVLGREESLGRLGDEAKRA
jgi:glutamyl-tRNA synthetase